MLASVRTSFRRFGDEHLGVAAVEFAILLPVMLLLYIGVIDVTRGVIASRKLNLLSRTISDLVSQQPTSLAVPISKLSTILGAATAEMQPFSTTSLALTVSAVDIKQPTGGTCCTVLVRWSYTQAGSSAYLRACTTPLTQVPNGTKPTLTNFPQSLVTANQTQGFAYASGASSYVIVADASYTYAPLLLGAINWLSGGTNWFGGGMSKTTFMVPRAPANPVTIADPSTAAAPQMGRICFN